MVIYWKLVIKLQVCIFLQLNGSFLFEYLLGNCVTLVLYIGWIISYVNVFFHSNTNSCLRFQNENSWELIILWFAGHIIKTMTHKSHLCKQIFISDKHFHIIIKAKIFIKNTLKMVSNNVKGVGLFRSRTSTTTTKKNHSISVVKWKYWSATK